MAGKELTTTGADGGAVGPALKPRGMLMPLYTAAAMMDLHKAVSELVQGSFVKDIDYGVIPGTGSKPSLLKPGAEKISVAFGASVRYEVMEQEIDHDREVRWTKKYKSGPPKTGVSFGIYRYVIRAVFYSVGTGEVLGEGIGACSTMESKYVDRPRDCENVVLKMGKKRALVDGSLSIFGLSDRFTQDVEDLKGTVVPGTPEEEAPDVKAITTLDEAKLVVVPGAPAKWDGNGGKAFGEVPAKILRAIYKWADSIITKAGSDGNEPDQNVVNWKVAAELILKANTPAPADGAAPDPKPKAGAAAGPVTDCCLVARASDGIDHDPACENYDDGLPF
jgi:hypothetical protein